METGTVDVRTRDTERHGKMRVDKLVEHLKTLEPAKSGSYTNFYKQAWSADKYKDVPLP
jgi:threonyl-tRNA synthetase